MYKSQLHKDKVQNYRPRTRHNYFAVRQELFSTENLFFPLQYQLTHHSSTMTKALSSLPQRPCVKRQQRYFNTPKRRHRCITTLEPPPAPKKRSETHQIYDDEARYNHVFGGHQSLFVPSLTSWDTKEPTTTTVTAAMDDVGGSQPSVMLRPRFSSSITSQLLQQPLLSCVGALPLFPLLDDDDCIVSDDDASEASDSSPMPLESSDFLDF